MKATEDLADAVADLLALEEATPFLRRLFSLQSGAWAAVSLLCADLPETVREIEELTEAQGGGTVYATWLDYPMSEYGPGYCTVIFFLEEAHWSTLALYNQGLFIRQAQRAVPPES